MEIYHKYVEESVPQYVIFPILMLLHLCQGPSFGFQHLSVIINLFRDMNGLSRSETELFFLH
jgi:hypothetical protein